MMERYIHYLSFIFSHLLTYLYSLLYSLIYILLLFIFSFLFMSFIISHLLFTFARYHGPYLFPTAPLFPDLVPFKCSPKLFYSPKAEQSITFRSSSKKMDSTSHIHKQYIWFVFLLFVHF